ncbi:major intrinsically disordered Notch2-binding receptor 1-like isoform X2 [Syngnathoides biaculeatus]|uniref:major intrinsically disordered Notch2-binding receptor 1-like isoform X2 n=1 Tax=Syngnathoides biaculeatus TaxID=300417 RepID=UPI002ADDCA0F|nr:major intrinsically disordered Notch2-binding receptor 1-like isoform X2 [Syngnathoides biaculeatus]
MSEREPRALLFRAAALEPHFPATPFRDDSRSERRAMAPDAVAVYHVMRPEGGRRGYRVLERDVLSGAPADEGRHLPRCSPSSPGVPPGPPCPKSGVFEEDFRKMAARGPQAVASEGARRVPEPYRPGPAPFFNRSFEAAYGNPYRAPPLHERRRVEHESLDDLQASTYFGPVESLSLNAEDERSHFRRAEAAARSPRPKAEESARRLRDGPSTEGGGKKGPTGTPPAARETSDGDSEPIADDISDIFRFLDESDSGDSPPERATVRLARSQLDRLLRSLDSADGELKVSVGELAARMGHIEKKLESLSGVRGEISQVLSKLNKLDRKIREPDAGDAGAGHRDAAEPSPAGRSHGDAAPPRAFRCRALAAAAVRVEAPKKDGFARRPSRSLDGDAAGGGDAAPGDRRTPSFSRRRDDDDDADDRMRRVNQASARGRHCDCPRTPRPPKASYVPDRRLRPPPCAAAIPPYSGVRAAAPSWNTERYKAKAGEDAIDVQAERVPASNKLAFWLEDVYTPGYDSLLKRREAAFRRAKACKVAALIAAAFSVILVIVVPICAMKT